MFTCFCGIQPREGRMFSKSNDGEVQRLESRLKDEQEINKRLREKVTKLEEKLENNESPDRKTEIALYKREADKQKQCAQYLKEENDKLRNKVEAQNRILEKLGNAIRDDVVDRMMEKVMEGDKGGEE